MRSIPEDSVLRRHFFSAIEYGQIPSGVPEDSVLRRHFLATLDTSSVSPKSGSASILKKAVITPAKPSSAQPDAVTRPRPTAERQKTNAIEVTNANNGGLMGWLKRLFGG